MNLGVIIRLGPDADDDDDDAMISGGSTKRKNTKNDNFASKPNFRPKMGCCNSIPTGYSMGDTSGWDTHGMQALMQFEPKYAMESALLCRYIYTVGQEDTTTSHLPPGIELDQGCGIVSCFGGNERLSEASETDLPRDIPRMKRTKTCLHPTYKPKELILLPQKKTRPAVETTCSGQSEHVHLDIADMELDSDRVFGFKEYDQLHILAGDNLVQWSIYRGQTYEENTKSYIPSNQIYVVFRGSVAISDWLINISPGVTKCKYLDGIHVHAGMQTALHCGDNDIPLDICKAIRTIVESEDTKSEEKSSDNRVKTMCYQNLHGPANTEARQGKRVSMKASKIIDTLVITGHSLGAGYAVITGAELFRRNDEEFKWIRNRFSWQRMFVNTFGGPQMAAPPTAFGVCKWWTRLENNTTHFVFEDDPIPRLGSSGWVDYVIPTYIKVLKCNYVLVEQAAEWFTNSNLDNMYLEFLNMMLKHRKLYYNFQPVGDLVLLHKRGNRNSNQTGSVTDIRNLEIPKERDGVQCCYMLEIPTESERYMKVNNFIPAPGIGNLVSTRSNSGEGLTFSSINSTRSDAVMSNDETSKFTEQNTKHDKNVEGGEEGKRESNMAENLLPPIQEIETDEKPIKELDAALASQREKDDYESSGKKYYNLRFYFASKSVSGLPNWSSRDIHRRLQHGRREVLSWWPEQIRDIFEDHGMQNYLDGVRGFVDWCNENARIKNATIDKIYGKRNGVWVLRGNYRWEEEQDMKGLPEGFDLYRNPVWNIRIKRKSPTLQYFVIHRFDGDVRLKIHPLCTSSVSISGSVRVFKWKKGNANDEKKVSETRRNRVSSFNKKRSYLYSALVLDRWEPIKTFNKRTVHELQFDTSWSWQVNKRISFEPNVPRSTEEIMEDSYLIVLSMEIEFSVAATCNDLCFGCGGEVNRSAHVSLIPLKKLSRRGIREEKLNKTK